MTTETTGAASSSKKSGDDRNADVAQLGYEDARDELARIVAQLEAGSVPLEESMRLWERGEALAAHCHKWLDDAQGRVEQLTGDKADH
nr:exodeoxyribonuclease VII small subunit [Calidifontibacter indicus]